MIEIIKTIEKEVENRSPYNTIFKKRKWFIKVSVCVILISPLILLYLIFKNLEYLIYSFAISIVLLTFYFYGYVNKYAKKNLPEGVTPTNGFWKHWFNDEYLKYKYKNFITVLKTEKVLTNNDEINIFLLDEYSKYYNLKAEKSKLSDILKVIGASVLAFFLPLWNQYLGKLFDAKNQAEYNINFEYSIKMLLLIICFIFLILYLKKMMKGILDAKSKKMEQIADELLNIKWNIKLKNND